MSMALKQSKAGMGYGSVGIGGGPLSGYGADAYSRRAYMGDPGLFGFLGKAIGGAAKIAGKILPGPVGIAASAIGGAIGGTSAARTTGQPWKGAPVPVATPPISRLAPPQQVPMVPTPGIGGAVQRFLPGGQTGYQPAGPAPSGYHWNKSDYFLKDGTFVPAGTKLVKNRRRNPLNPRAASRAISRLESAKKATKRLDRIAIKCKRCGYSSCRCK